MLSSSGMSSSWQPHMDCSPPGFSSRQEYWSGLPFLSPGDLLNPGIEPTSPALAGGFFTTEPFLGLSYLEGKMEMNLCVPGSVMVRWAWGWGHLGCTSGCPAHELKALSAGALMTCDFILLPEQDRTRQQQAHTLQGTHVFGRGLSGSHIVKILKTWQLMWWFSQFYLKDFYW